MEETSLTHPHKWATRIINETPPIGLWRIEEELLRSGAIWYNLSMERTLEEGKAIAPVGPLVVYARFMKYVNNKFGCFLKLSYTLIYRRKLALYYFALDPQGI